MENKSFFSYLGGKINLVIVILSGAGSIWGLFKDLSLKLIIIIVLSTICLILISSLYRIYSDQKSLKSNFNEKEEELEKLIKEHKQLEKQFNDHAEQYSVNIKSINRFKRLAHAVDLLANSTDPQSKSEKALIDKLKYSLEKKSQRQ